MQVAKYWRTKKLRYRLEGMARRDERVAVRSAPVITADHSVRNGRKREPARLLR